MKKLLLSLVLVSICSSISFGEITFDYTISDTHVGGYTLNGESLLVTGAGANLIHANFDAYIEVQDTAPLQQHVGGMFAMNLTDASSDDRLSTWWGPTIMAAWL